MAYWPTHYWPTHYWPTHYWPTAYVAPPTVISYRLYRGKGGLGAVDFDTVIAEFLQGATSGSVVGAGHEASTSYTYVLRPVINDLETPDYSCRCEMVTDGAGEWTGLRPAPVEVVEAEVSSGGDIIVRWAYRTPYGQDAPEDFGVYYSTTPDITPGSPDASEAYTADCLYSETLLLEDGVSYWFAVTARTAGGVESELSEIIGPFVADAGAPATPEPTITVRF